MSSSNGGASAGGGNGERKSSPFDVFLNKKKGSSSSLHDDCDRPACEDTVSALTSALNRLNKKEINKSGGTGSSSSGKVCPPSKDTIGSSSWTLLHSMAAWYPEKPTLEEQTKMSQFMEALAIFYPCTYCAEDFQSNLHLSPAKTQSRKDLCVWLCEQHNLVNEKLDKPIFDCSMKNLDERWRKSSDPSCSDR